MILKTIQDMFGDVTTVKRATQLFHDYLKASANSGLSPTVVLATLSIAVTIVAAKLGMSQDAVCNVFKELPWPGKDFGESDHVYNPEAERCQTCDAKSVCSKQETSFTQNPTKDPRWKN
mgnify:CR=1 FL=1